MHITGEVKVPSAFKPSATHLPYLNQKSTHMTASGNI